MSRAAVALLALAACLPRVTLPELPAPDAPLGERLEAQKALTPVPRELCVSTLTGLRYQDQPCPFLQLGNGLEVWDPRDLLPAVNFTSPTAEAVGRYTSRGEFARFGLIASLGVFLIGAGLATYGLLGGDRHHDLFTGLGFGMLFTGVVSGTVSFVAYLARVVATQDAFKTYPGDLADVLGVPPMGKIDPGPPVAPPGP